jgi:hypothetical protein
MHLICKFLILAVFAVVFKTTAVKAAEFSTEEGEDGFALITISGDLVAADEQRFKKLAAVFDKAAVLLDSDGGSTIAAIKIGEAIKLKGYSTFVGNEMTCSSACALIWLAGSPRFLEPNAKVGFHATYIEKDGRRQESGGGNALVGRYLTLLNLSERAVYFATSAAPSQLNYLNANNYKSLGIDVSVLADEPVQNTEPPPVVRTVTPPPVSQATNNDVSKWKSVGGWTVNVDHTLNNSCFAIGFSGSSAFRAGFDVANEFSSYFLVGDDSWKSIVVDREYELRLRFDDNAPWKVTAVGSKIGGSVALKSTFNENKFWAEFAQARRLAISYNQSSLINVSTSDNEEAFNELIECQKAQKEKAKPDPFRQ